MSLKLMVDMSTDVSGSVELNESSGEKKYIISGNFSTPDKKNRNGRIYSKNIWESNVARYQNEILNNTNNTLMELEHPPRTQVDPWEAVAKIRKLEMRDGYVYGEAVILNNGDKKTNQIKALIEAGVKIGVSTRGTGKMKGDIVEVYNLITVDVVSNPSNYESSLEGFNESMILENMDIELDESGKYVCTPAGCTLVENEEELEEAKKFKKNQTIYYKHNGEYVKVKIDQVLRGGGARFYIDREELVLEPEETHLYKLKLDEDIYNLDESLESDIKDYLKVMKNLRKSVKKEDKFIYIDFIHSVTKMSNILEKVYPGAAYDSLYDSVQLSPSCGCKVDTVIETLTKFASKNEIEAKENADRELKEKFESLFGKKEMINEGKDENKANEILKKELSKKYEVNGNSMNGFSIKIGDAVGRITFEEMYRRDFQTTTEKVISDLKQNNSFKKVSLEKDGTIYVEFKGKGGASQFENQPGLKSIFRVWNVTIDHAINGMSGDEFFLKIGKQ